MKKIIISLIFVFFIYPNYIFAILTVDKYYLLLNDKIRNTSITVYNSSNEDKNYKVSIINYKQLPSGEYKVINSEENGIKFASNHIIYTPIKFHIEKKKSQIIRIQKKPMPNAPTGEYLSYILITELPQDQDIKKIPSPSESNQITLNITPVFSIALPIVVRKGELISKASIGKIIIHNKKDKTLFNIIINRTGTKSLRGNLLIKHKNKIIKEISGVNVFLTNKNRNVRFEIPTNDLKKYKKSNNFTVEFVDFYNNTILSSKEFKV